MELKNYKILIVDDEEDIREFLEYVLKKEGAITEVAVDGKDAVLKATNSIPDLILLDRMMPVQDGINTCIELRDSDKFKKTKIIFLSALGEVESQVEGLDIGADDYIIKPIKSNLLISKIKSHLRTKDQDALLKDTIQYKHIKVDRNRYIAQIGEEEISLPKKEFELLFLLMSNPNNVFRREEILEKVWSKDLYIGDRTIDVHIRKIREKIGEDYFKTIKGIGYKFVAF